MVILAGMLGLFVLVFWLAMKSRRLVAGPPPMLVVDEQKLSFGEVWEDSAFVWILPIRNTTNKDVEIVEFMADCSCGRIEPPSLKIPAHGTRKVHLTLDLRGKASPAKGPNPFRIKLIPVFSGGLHPRGWEIHGRVRVPAKLTPSSLSFEYLEKQPPRSLSQVVRIKCLCPCEKATPRCDANLATIRVTKDAKQTDEYHLNVSPSPALTVGKHQFAIQVRLEMGDNEQYASVQLPVSVEVKSEYYVVPSLPHWGAVKIGERPTEFFQLRSRSGKDFAVTKIICRTPNVKVVPLHQWYSLSHVYRVECRFSEPGEYIEKVEFFVKGEGVQSNGKKSELERVGLEIKCQVFSD